MTIKEMEEQIDVLNLDKLEVKMKKGRQVHFFVCGRKRTCLDIGQTEMGKGRLV